jgi:hypothetical protein
MVNAHITKSLDPEKTLRELGFSVLLQLTFGAIFTMFSIGITLFNGLASRNPYFMSILMGVIMIFSMPLIYLLGKRYIGVKIKKPDNEPPNIKVWALVILMIWILDKIGFDNLLMNFTEGNEEAGVFLVLIPLMAFFLHKTNLIVEAFIFVLGVILLHILESQITLTYLVVFYFFMGIVFLTGGIMDFRKFSKIPTPS